MKPYYEEAGIQIFHGDCREILPSLPKVDLALTDPPYGIGRDGMRPSTSTHGGRRAYEFLGWDSETPSAETFDAIFAASANQIIWGANYFTRPLSQNIQPMLGDNERRYDVASRERLRKKSNRHRDRGTLLRDRREQTQARGIEL